MSIHIAICNVYDPSMLYEYDVDLEISVEEVKKLIQQSIPSQPAIEEMRLIFGGKICNNESLLKMVFQDTYDMTITQRFHLLLKSTPLNNKRMEIPPSSTSSTVSSTSIVETSSDPVPPSSSNVAASQSPLAQTMATPFVPPTQTMTPPELVPTSVPISVEGNTAISPQEYMSQYQSMMMMQMQLFSMQQMQIYNMQRQQSQTSTNNSVPTNAASLQGQPMIFAGSPIPGFPPPAVAGLQAHQAPPAPAPFSPVPAPAARNNNNNNENNNNGNNANQVLYHVINFKLLLKLVFALAFLGQDMSNDKFYFMIVAAILVYGYFTGLFQLIYRRFAGPVIEPHGNNDANANVPNRPSNESFRFFQSMGNVTVSSEPGALKDIFYFCCGFWLSLIPMWRPIRHQVTVPPPIPPVEVQRE